MRHLIYIFCGHSLACASFPPPLFCNAREIKRKNSRLPAEQGEKQQTKNIYIKKINKKRRKKTCSAGLATCPSVCQPVRPVLFSHCTRVLVCICVRLFYGHAISFFISGFPVRSLLLLLLLAAASSSPAACASCTGRIK